MAISSREQPTTLQQIPTNDFVVLEMTNNNNPSLRARNERSNLSNKNLQTISADYIVYVEPASSNPLMQFLPTTNTLTFVEDSTQNQPFVYVNSIPQTIDQTIKLTDFFDRTPLENKVIRIYDNADTTLIDTALTNANGEVTFKDIPAGTTLYLAYGEAGANPSYYAKVGDVWNMPPSVVYLQDTIAEDTIRLTLVPKALPIPATPNDPNYNTTIDTLDVAVIKEAIKCPPISTHEWANTEEAMERKIRLYMDPNWNSAQVAEFQDLMRQGDSLLYGIPLDAQQSSRWYVFVSDSIDINFIYNNGQYYNHNNNFFPGELGWNIRDGPGLTDAKIVNNYETNNRNQYNEDKIEAIIGGTIHTHPNDNTEVFKELYGRRTGMDDVFSRASFMNLAGGTPTLIDRVIYNIERVNDKNEFFYKTEMFGLSNLENRLP